MVALHRNAVGVNTRLLKRLRPLNSGTPVIVFLGRGAKSSERAVRESVPPEGIARATLLTTPGALPIAAAAACAATK